MKKLSSNFLPMVSITILFFMWGFITSLNDILIPFFKSAYTLTHFEANVVQLAFFIAYFVGSLIFFFLSKINKDPIYKLGYKLTLEIGLVISGVACFLFSLSAQLNLSFFFFLSTLFLLGIGLTFLQVAANPFVSILGNKETASSRLNLSQAFNSLGTTLGPALGGYFIFGILLKNIQGVQALREPYMILGLLLGLLALFIHNSKIEEPEKVGNKTKDKTSIFKYTYLLLGALGIFFYVGAEVSIGSNMVAYLTEVLNGEISHEKASSYLSYYWGGMMIGRFLGAVSLSREKKEKKIIYMLLLAVGSFLVIFFVNYYLHNLTFDMVWYFLIFMVLNFLFFYIGGAKPERTLAIFALVNSILLILGMNPFSIFSSNFFWFLLAIGLFNSIMWSNLFTLAIDNLKEKTPQASSMLVMMILGGAILPPLQGLLADYYNIKISFLIPLISYIYLIFYGLKGYKINKKFE
ncbi:MAG: MFS transporter [Bacteroidales bacterium]|nr:MFS transporter [Bacteroidales bacterium]